MVPVKIAKVESLEKFAPTAATKKRVSDYHRIHKSGINPKTPKPVTPEIYSVNEQKGLGEKLIKAKFKLP